MCPDKSLRSLNHLAAAPGDPVDQPKTQGTEPRALDLADPVGTANADRITAPLRLRTFRHIWVASLISNLGSLV